MIISKMTSPNEYKEAWFVTDLPSDGLPESFGIVTAFNPNGCEETPAKNNSADTKLQDHLENAGLQHFRVTGGSQDSNIKEPGFGIVATSIDEIRDLSLQFKQEAFFWVENGTIFLYKTDSQHGEEIAPWTKRQM